MVEVKLQGVKIQDGGTKAFSELFTPKGMYWDIFGSVFVMLIFCRISF